MQNLVAIVGRPNVGKSTLYNRLTGQREAIIDDISGVTRDRLYGTSFWNGKTFTVIDTGGLVQHSDDIWEAAIREQVMIAIDEADAIVFVVDASTGITDLDEEVAEVLRRKGGDRHIFLAVNKVESQERMLAANEFWALGIEETHFISAITGSGSGELLDAVVEVLSEDEPPELDLPRVAILGQPNVGKSSLVNALLDEERNIVTDVAGTTRDSIHSHYNKYGHEFILIDTAGMRKKNKVHENLEFYSVMRAIRALESADVCVLMMDASLGIEAQDLSLFNLALQRKKGIVILVNKWDLVEKETYTARDMEQVIKKRLAPFNDVPVIFISVLDKQRIFKSVETIMDVYERRSQRIPTSQLNEDLLPLIERTPPPSHRGRFIKIKYVSQLKGHYPIFGFFCNHPQHIKASYRQFLENKIRSLYNFTGIPITVVFKEK